MSPERNTHWQMRVREYLRQGFGVEDIALKLGCAPDDVRREISILRQEGRLAKIVKPKVKA